MQVHVKKRKRLYRLKIPLHAQKIGGDTIKVVHNVVRKAYRLLVTYADGRQETVEIEAESLTAAALLLPGDAVVWEPVGDNLT